MYGVEYAADLRAERLTALAAALTTVVLWASAFVGIRSAGKSLSPGPLSLGRLLIGVAALGLVAFARRERLPSRVDLKAVWAGLLVNWAYALARTGAGRMGATTYLVPPISVLLGWLVLDESPPALALAGGTLCLLGVIAARRG
jgi:drug/metabolite transporter (DMT)-like permease